jgi:small subunit ribosomal protein S20
MANKKAAQKSMAQSRKRAIGNCAVRGRLKTLAKRFRVALDSGTNNVQETARAYVSALEKAAKRNVIHRNFVNQRKCALAKYVVQ